MISKAFNCPSSYYLSFSYSETVIMMFLTYIFLSETVDPLLSVAIDLIEEGFEICHVARQSFLFGLKLGYSLTKMSTNSVISLLIKYFENWKYPLFQ